MIEMKEISGSGHSRTYFAFGDKVRVYPIPQVGYVVWCEGRTIAVVSRSESACTIANLFR